MPASPDLGIVYRCRTFYNFPFRTELNTYPAHGWKLASVVRNRSGEYFTIFEGTNSSVELSGMFDAER